MNTAEKNFILSSLKSRLSEKDIQKIRLDASQVSNWQVVLQSAAFHGVLPLLYKCLKKVGPEILPSDLFEQLKTLYRKNAAKNLSAAATLLNILKLFKENGINAVPFKGPLAAEQIYGDVGMRMFTDLDIFIKKADAIKAKNLLIDYGYNGDINLPPEKECKYLDFENSFSFYPKNGDIPIDLHWEMTGRYLLKPIYLEQFEKQLEPFNFMGQDILVIPYDVMLVYLCIHGTSHCWERLDWLFGFSEMAQHHEVDIYQILTLATAMGCKRMFLLGLQLSCELLNAELPKKVIKEIAGDRGVTKAAFMIKQLLFDHKTNKNGDAEWRFSPLHISLRDSYFDRIRYAIYLYTAPTVKEWSKLSLPSCMTPLYRAIRPIRLGTSYLMGKREKDA